MWLYKVIHFRMAAIVDDLICTRELIHTAEFLRDWQSGIAISSAIGQWKAVPAGVGIGIPHDFLTADAPDLVRLFPDLSVSRTYWIAWHGTCASRAGERR